MALQRLNRTTAFTVACIGIVLLSAGLLLFGSERIVAIMTNLGTFASVVGLAFVMLQLLDLKDTARITKESSDETRKRVFALLTALDIATAIKTVQEIQVYNRAGKFELSILRMQELNSALLAIQNSDRLKPYMKPHALARHVADLSLNLASVEKELLYPSGTLNVAGLNGFLEGVSHYLTDLHAKTKNQELI